MNDDEDDHIDTTPVRDLPKRLLEIGRMLYESGGARDYDCLKRAAYELETLSIAVHPEEVKQLRNRLGEAERTLLQIRLAVCKS